MIAGEVRFAAAVLLAAGSALAAFAVGIDRLAGAPSTELGPLQIVMLATGVAMLGLGGGLLGSFRVRGAVRRFWPFGNLAPERPGRILLFALWLGGLAALLDLGLRFLQHETGQRWDSLNPHAGWITPASYGAMMLLAGGLLALFAARGWRHLGSPRLAAFALLAVLVASLLSVYESELHWLPIGFLTLGIAARGSSYLVRRRVGLGKVVRASARPLAFAVALAAVLPFAWQETSEWNGLSAMPDAPPSSPNVLLIVLDTVRAQNLSLYGYVRETSPVLEELARRAAVFDRAFAPSSWTLPSHASMFTGQPPHRQSSNYGRPLDDALPTLAEVLQRRGWYTLGVVANHDNAFPHTGLDRGFLRYHAGVASANEALDASGAGRVTRWLMERFGTFSIGPTRKDADVINARFLDLVKRRGERPFFAFLNYYDAHFPFDGPLPPRTLIPRWTRPDVPLQIPALMERIDHYDREIAFLDDRVGRLLAALDQRGILRETVVIVTSDHGEEFSEHGSTGHGWNVYDTSLRVPLLIAYPPLVPEGLRVGAPVSLQDLPATVMALTGLGGAGPFPGGSLVPPPAERAGAAAPVLSELSGTPETPLDEVGGWDQRSIVQGSFHYIRTAEGGEELFDLDRDPWEQRDLSGLARGAALLPGLRAALAALVSGSAGEGRSGDGRGLASVPGREPERQR